jgi:hypothetical protein
MIRTVRFAFSGNLWRKRYIKAMLRVYDANLEIEKVPSEKVVCCELDDRGSGDV